MNFTETILEDEFPLIRFAITEQGNVVIVLTVDHDDETNVYRYLHVPVSPEQEQEYRGSKITLREIILSTPTLDIVETDENDVQLYVYQFKPAEFPKEYLPLDSSFIPRSYLRN